VNHSVEISIVVPMYGSEESIVELVTRIRESLAPLYKNSFEIILVNDSSPDNVLSTVKSELMGEDIVLVDLMRNFGQGNAIMAGLEFSRGEIVVTIDDDLQFPPESIGDLITKLSEDLDVVYGIPIASKQRLYRTFGSRFINRVYRTLFGRKHDRSSFLAIRRPIVDAITGHEGSSHFPDGLILWYTERVGTIPIEKADRKFGKSGWKFSDLVRSGLDMITNYSRSPLLVTAWIGFFSALCAVILGSFYVVMTLIGGRVVPGWASVIVSVSFFSAIQLFILGVMGEYVARLQTNSNSKPKFLIREIVNGSESEE